jgi:glyoxylase-like metal-dependent hydrolase (beta-lactamase superfamily II)
MIISRAIKFGAFELQSIPDGDFWLDGGSMYGTVPKVLWKELTPADRENRIRLSLNCLLVKAADKMVLVDTGIGEKFSKRHNEIYKTTKRRNLLPALAACDVKPADIDYVINTHLHFDHCGGNTMREEGKYVPTFPNAEYIIQEQEWFSANHTNEKTRSSYRPSDFLPLKETGQLRLINGDCEIVDGIKTIVTRGHTAGHQSVLITNNDNHALYLGDLVPTTHHLKLPYLTGYDLYPIELLDTKKEIIERAVAEEWLLVFEHDPKTVFAYITKEDGVIKLLSAGARNNNNQNLKSKQNSKNQFPEYKTKK